MAEALLVTCAEGAVKVLIGKLARVLSQELQLLQGVEKEVHYIKGELEGMQSFLSNLARSDDHNDQVKTWMKQVREMAYDAEDCIDQFLHQMIAYLPRNGLDYEKNDKEQSDSSIKRLRNAWSDVKICSKNLLHQLKASRCSCNVDIFSNSLLHRLMLRRKLSTRIQDLRRRAEDVSKRNLSYGVSIEGNGNGIIAGRDGERDKNLQAGPIDNNLLFGIDEPANGLIKCLRKESAECRVLSVVGLGGLGKTTLAKVVYENSTITAEYDCRAFVTVSQKFDLRRLLVDILKQVNITVDFDQSDITMNHVYWRLKGMKYLIVLDDAWSIHAWESIRPAFPDEQNGSRIIITTRIEAVANACCSEDADIYIIKPLNNKYAQKLFWNILGYDANGSDSTIKGSITSMETLKIGDSSGAGTSHASSSGHSEVTVSLYVEHTENEITDFSTSMEALKVGDSSGVDSSNASFPDLLEKAASQDVEPTGNEIKIGGPDNSKSASSLNGQFAARPVQLEHAGSKIIKKCGGMPLAIIYIAKVLASKQGTKEEWDKFCNSIGSQLENHPSLDGMKQILTLSFNNLPYHLKSCFLYLSIYPEDYEIRRKNLVRRWVAEGFVAARRGMSAEEVADSYFEELLGRSIIQRGKVGYGGMSDPDFLNPNPL